METWCIARRIQTTKKDLTSTMKYCITRNDGGNDDITSQSFDNYDDAYDLLGEVYGDIYCSDAANNADQP